MLIAEWRQPVELSKKGRKLKPTDLGHLGEVIRAVCAGCFENYPVTVTTFDQEWWVGQSV